MALGVTSCTQKIFDAFVSDDKSKTFYHGHSFTANPLACTAAIASIYLLNKVECLNNIGLITSKQNNFISKLAGSINKLKTKNHRVLGTISAFEIITNEEDNYLNNLNTIFTEFCIAHGVYLRPLGNTVYIMPPYCITNEQLDTIYEAIFAFLDMA